jgi:hypothetical protein
VPTRDGFTGVFHYLTNTEDGWFADYWRHDAAFVQSGRTIIGKIVSAGTPFGTVAIAGTLNWAGLARRPQLWMLGWNATDLHCGHDLASAGTVFGLGGDANGRVLVVTDGGSGNIDAQWFDENCTAMTGAFRLITGFQAGANTWFETAPLIDGGVAVRRVDQQNDGTGRPYTTSRWLVTVPLGATRATAAPQWLTSRPDTNMAIVRSGRAYAMLPLGAPAAICGQMIDILASDGTQCGSFAVGLESGLCRTEDVTLALDGTPIQLRPRASFPGSCAYRWWPSALR